MAHLTESIIEQAEVAKTEAESEGEIAYTPSGNVAQMLIEENQLAPGVGRQIGIDANSIATAHQPAPGLIRGVRRTHRNSRKRRNKRSSQSCGRSRTACGTPCCAFPHAGAARAGLAPSRWGAASFVPRRPLSTQSGPSSKTSHQGRRRAAHAALR